MRRMMGLALVLAMQSAVGSDGRGSSPALAGELEALDEASFTMPIAQRAGLLRARYDAAAQVKAITGQCDGVAAQARPDLFEATRTVNFYQRDPVLLARMRCLLDDMQRDGQATPLHATRLHGALIAQRRFEDANTLRDAQQLDVPRLPVIRGTAGPGLPVLRLDGQGHADRTGLPDSGWRIVALVHPYCGYSRRALDAIATDDRFAPLQGRLQLVVPGGRKLAGKPDHRVEQFASRPATDAADAAFRTMERARPAADPGVPPDARWRAGGNDNRVDRERRGTAAARPAHAAGGQPAACRFPPLEQRDAGGRQRLPGGVVIVRTDRPGQLPVEAHGEAGAGRILRSPKHAIVAGEAADVDFGDAALA